MHESNRRFLNNRLFQYMLPGFIMAVMLNLWKVVDTILTGMIDGTHAMSAIVLSLPVETLIQFPGFCLGIGGSIVAGRLLGARNNKGASQMMTYTVIIVAAIGLIFAAAAFFLAKPIALGLSGGGELFEDTYYFIFINMLGAPVIGLGLLMTGYLGIEKNEKISTAYLLTANMLNFILDVLSLKLTDFGVKGAAIATILGFMFSLAIFVPYLVAPGSQLKFIMPDKSVNLDPVIKMCKGAIGDMSISFVTELGMSLVIIYMIGDWGMPAFAICRNILLLTGILTAGCISIVHSLVKMMKKEYDFNGIRKLCKITLIMASVICVVLVVLAYVLADGLVDLYAIEGASFESLEYYLAILIHIFIVCLPAYMWNRYFASYYESVGQKKYSDFISALSGGVLMIPCVILGVLIGKSLGGSGIYGLALGYVISEITILGLSFLYRRLKLNSKAILMIPRENPGNCLDLSIRAEMENTPSIPEKVMQFCRDNKIKKRVCMFAAVAAEEMTVNSIKFGGKDSEWVDICLVVNENKLILRLRDKGVPFNPTEYEFDKDKFDISGIRLVKLVSSRISYMRLVNMNNTVIEFDDIR